MRSIVRQTRRAAGIAGRVLGRMFGDMPRPVPRSRRAAERPLPEYFYYPLV